MQHPANDVHDARSTTADAEGRLGSEGIGRVRGGAIRHDHREGRADRACHRGIDASESALEHCLDHPHVVVSVVHAVRGGRVGRDEVRGE